MKGLPLAKYKKPVTILVCALVAIGLCAFLVRTDARKDYVRIQAAYDDTSHILTVTQRVDYNNRAGEPITEIIFNAYPNAYREKSLAPVPSAEMGKAYPNGWNGGSIKVEAVLLNGQPQRYEFSGEQAQWLKLPLTEPLPRHGSCDITFTYSIKIPQNTMRMGYSDTDVRLGNCFLTPAVYQDGTLLLDEYASIGDSFVAHIADYDVQLSLPPAYVAAGVGLISIDDGLWHFKVQNVREMAFVLSTDYEISQSEQDGVTVRSFAFTQESAKESREYAQRALHVFSELFGEYPYNDFSLCSASFYVGGMEYPGLAMIDNALYTADDGMLEFVTVHEVAHQWWYAAVGSDQVRHAWQDEALAEYATLLYYETVYGAQSFDTLYQSMIRPATESSALHGVALDQPLSNFSTSTTYDALVYRKGAAMLHDVRAVMGNDGFFSALRTYYKRNLFRIATPTDFLNCLGGTAAQRALQWLGGER